MKKVVFTTTIKFVTIIALLATVVAMVGMYFFFVAPKHTQVNEIEKETTDIMEKIQVVKAEKQLLSEQPGLYDSAHIQGIPSEIEVRGYFEMIETNLATKGARISRATLEEKEFFQAETDPSKLLQVGTYSFDFSAETKEQLFTFAEALEADGRFIRFHSYTYETESIFEKIAEAVEETPEESEKPAEVDDEKFKLTVVYDVFYMKEVDSKSKDEQQ